MNTLDPLPGGDTQAFSKEFHGVSNGLVYRLPQHPSPDAALRENFTGYFIPVDDTTTVERPVAYYVTGKPSAHNHGLTPDEVAAQRGHPISGDGTTRQRRALNATYADIPF